MLCQLARDESLKLKCNKGSMADIKALPLCPPKSHDSGIINHKATASKLLRLKASLSNYITRLLPVIIVTGPRNDCMQVPIGLWPSGWAPQWSYHFVIMFWNPMSLGGFCKNAIIINSSLNIFYDYAQMSSAEKLLQYIAAGTMISTAACEQGAEIKSSLGPF